MARMDDSSVKEELYSVARLKTAEALARKFDTLKRQRERLDQQWKLNLAFFDGKQYAYIDRIGRLATRSTEESELPKGRQRLVSNQIMSGSFSLLSKLTKTKPIMAATPGSSSDHDIKAAQMAEDLLEYWWQDLGLEDAMEEALLWGIVAGQGYWKISWDPHAGKSMKFMLDPEGKPITDESLKDSFRGQLAQMNIPPAEQTVYLGDIRVESMSPFDVYLDPSARTFKDCKYAICVHYLDVDEVKARWGVTVKPDSVATTQDTLLPFPNADNPGERTLKRVFIGYFLPMPSLPNGRFVVWTDEPKQILADDPWTYPTAELPLVKFPGIRVPGRIYDSSVVEHAIPMQKELNRTLSQIVEYKNLTIRPRVWAPVGSLRQRITTEPGQIYEFTPIGGLKPELEKLPTMPPYVFEHLKEISSRLREAFFLAEVTEGTVPPNVEAGIAIDLLQEMSTDRIAPVIKLVEAALARAGNTMLSLAQKYYIEPRLMKIRGSGGSVQVRRFTQADIDGGVSVVVEAGSGLPRTRAGRQARIQSYVEMGVLRPEQAWKYLDIADMKSVAKLWQSDEDRAYREHEKLIRGIPINTAAANAAMQIVVAGVNPETQAPFESPEEAVAFVQNAALSPFPFENSAVDRDVHRVFMNSVEFENLPEDAQQRFITHYELTEQRLSAQTPPPEPQAPRVSTTFRGTFGPTVATRVLEAAGIQGVTPEMFMEPPLETWISDDLDEPNAPTDEQGNPLEVVQEEEMHQEKLREQKAKADIAEKKARAPVSGGSRE